jgi:hypothetical protein
MLWVCTVLFLHDSAASFSSQCGMCISGLFWHATCMASHGAHFARDTLVGNTHQHLTHQAPSEAVALQGYYSYNL